MNVTIELSEDLVGEASNRAVINSKSLSGWMSDLIRRELAAPAADSGPSKTWMEAMVVPEMPDS